MLVLGALVSSGTARWRRDKGEFFDRDCWLKRGSSEVSPSFVESVEVQFLSLERNACGMVQVAMPEGLVVVGDAVCTFNPVYGQGMTVATLGAMLLGSLLRDRLRPGEATTPSARLLALQGLPQVPLTQPLRKTALGADLSAEESANSS